MKKLELISLFLKEGEIKADSICFCHALFMSIKKKLVYTIHIKS